MRLVFILLFCLLPLTATAGRKEDDAYSLFVTHCVTGMKEPKEFAASMRPYRKQKLPKTQARELLMQPGHVWHMKSKLNEYFLFIVDTGACGIQFTYLDYKKIRSTWEEKTLTRPAEQSEDDKQILAIYLVMAKPRNRPEGTYMNINLLGGKLSTMKNMVTLSAISKVSFDKLGLALDWPKSCPASTEAISACEDDKK